MTWTYKLTDSSNLSVYDHTGSHITVVQNDGSGIRLPDDVVDVMRDEAETARDNNNTERWRDIHIRLATNDIEEREG
jgi:hypothetical protein